MKPRISYVICATPRTGSNMLSRGLRETGICGEPDEYFNYHIAVPVTITKHSLKNFSEYLSMVLDEKTGKNGVFGFKVHWDQFKFLTDELAKTEGRAPSSFVSALESAFGKPCFIYLKRKDKIRQAVSWLIALQTNNWLDLKDGPAPFLSDLRKGRPKYDRKALDRLIDSIEKSESHWNNFFSENSIEPLEIVYEEMVGAYTETIDHVLAYLKLGDIPARRILAPPTRSQSNKLNERWALKYSGKSSNRNRRLLFITEAIFYPESVGGSELSHLYLLRELKKRGWEVEIICRTREEGREDMSLGVMRHAIRLGDGSFRSFVSKKLKTWKPDVVLGHGGGPPFWEQINLMKKSAELGYATFCFVHNVDFFEAPGNIQHLPAGVNLLFNSPYTEKILRPLMRSSVEMATILPVVELEKYKAVKREPMYITLINPVPEKGVEVALEIAAKMPERQFLFVQARWALPQVWSAMHETWIQKAKSQPNITVWDVQDDMRQVYAVTDVLLVPSQFKETFCRVILEAHLNGIPVVASSVGGIPYTMGGGGILVDRADDAVQYVTNIKLLRNNKDLYNRLSEKAIQNSRRVEFHPEYQVDQFILSMERFLRRNPPHFCMWRRFFYIFDSTIQTIINVWRSKPSSIERRSKLYQLFFKVFGATAAKWCEFFYTSIVPERLRSAVREYLK